MTDRAATSREEQKYQTRRTLMRAALTLMTEGQGFGELSLRGVTREAGLAPTAFYRHFENMEELGLSLVDETFVTLRRMLREVWQIGRASCRERIGMLVRHWSGEQHAGAHRLTPPALDVPEPW